MMLSGLNLGQVDATMLENLWIIGIVKNVAGR